MATFDVATRRYSVEDLELFPDDGKRRELVNGRLVEWEMPGWGHGALIALLNVLLGSVVRASRLGYIVTADSYVRILGSRHDVRGPDLAFFRRRPSPDEVWAAATTAVPDFVIEVVSPSDRAAEVEEKVRDWLRAGVPLLWYINPMAGVTMVYEGADGPIRRVEADELLDAGSVVSGFSVHLRDLLDEIEGAEGSKSGSS